MSMGTLLWLGKMRSSASYGKSSACSNLIQVAFHHRPVGAHCFAHGSRGWPRRCKQRLNKSTRLCRTKDNAFTSFQGFLGRFMDSAHDAKAYRCPVPSQSEIHYWTNV
jgi:hypothetical protein